MVLLRYRLSSAAASAPQIKLKLPGQALKSIVFTPFLDVPMNLQHFVRLRQFASGQSGNTPFLRTFGDDSHRLGLADFHNAGMHSRCIQV
jgi:hypothetical protein